MKNLLALLLLADYLQQIPLVNEPELRIDRFTLNEAHEYFGSDRNIFSAIWGIAPSARNPENRRVPLRVRETLQLDPACGGGYYNMALGVKEA